FATQKNQVFRWNIRWAARRSEHLSLHYAFNLTSNRDQELLPRAAHRRLLLLHGCDFITVEPFLEFAKEIRETDHCSPSNQLSPYHHRRSTIVTYSSLPLTHPCLCTSSCGSAWFHWLTCIASHPLSAGPTTRWRVPWETVPSTAYW